MNSIAKRFISNSGWMMGQRIYYMLLSLVIGSLSARYLGPSNYGIINYGASFISFFTTISALGLDSVVINEMIKSPEKKGSYLGTALILRLFVSVFSVILIFAIVRFIEPGNIVLHVVTLLQSFAIVLQAYEVLNYWFQLTLKMKYVSLAVMLAQTVVGIWRIFLLINKAPVYGFALSSSIQFFVSGIVVCICFFRQKEQSVKLSFSKKDGKYLISKSYNYIISGLAITFYTQIDKVMIGKLINSEAVGFYSAAATIAALWEFVPIALINSARPLIIESKGHSKEEFIKRLQWLFLVITIFSIIVSLGVVIFGKYVILLLYGETFLNSIVPLCILVWATGISVIGVVRGIWIVAEDLNKYTKYCFLIGAIVNFVLNYFAINICGIIGASITTLISQIVVVFICPLFFKQIHNFLRIYFYSFKYLPEVFNIAIKYIKKS